MLSSYKAKIKMQSSVTERVSIEGKVVEVLGGIPVEERWSVPMHSSHVRHKIQLQRSLHQKVDFIKSAAHQTNLSSPL